MKKLLIILASLLLPFTVSAQITTHAGGTGLIDISSGSIPFGSTFNVRLATSSGLQWDNVNKKLTFTNGSSTAQTISSALYLPTIASGNCLQTSTGGLIVSSGSACGSGGGGSGTVSTSTNETKGFLSYWTSNSGTPALLGQVATTSVTCSGSVSCTVFTAIGSSPITIAGSGGGTGLSTTSPVSAGNLLVYSATGAGSAFGVATSTITLPAYITYSGTLGSVVGGASGNLAISQLPIANGGTNGTSFNNNGIVYFDGTKLTNQSVFTVSSVGAVANSNTTATLNFGTDNLPANTLFDFASTTNNFLQGVVHNKSNGALASSDLVVCNDKTTDCATYYGNFGVNSSGYTQAGFEAESANDVYLYSNDSNLHLAAASSTGPANIFFETTGHGTASVRQTITSGGLIGIGTTTPWGMLSISHPAIGANIPLFVIASSTATATTTLFRIDNTGIASTTGLVISNTAGAGTRCLQTDTNGVVSANASACGSGGGGGDSFTHTAIWGQPAVSATTSVMNFTANLTIASSTLVISSTTGSQLGISDETPTGAWWLRAISGNLFLATSTSGSPTATSSVPALSIYANNSTGLASSTPWGFLSVNPINFTGPAFAIGSSSGTLLSVGNGGKTAVTTQVPVTNAFAVSSTTAGNPVFGVDSLDSSLYIFSVSSSSGASFFNINGNGDIILGGSKPTLNVCGTATITATSTDTRGTINVSAGTPTSCTMTFAHAKADTPTCLADGPTSALGAVGAIASTSGVKFDLPAVYSGSFRYWCPQ